MSDEQMLLAVYSSKLRWLEARKDEPQGYNRTPHSLCCYGNPAGFLTLADFLLVARNEPIPVFDALSLGFVTASGFHHFSIEVAAYSDGQAAWPAWWIRLMTDSRGR